MTSPAPLSRVLLVADKPASPAGEQAKIRRYRLARLHVEGRRDRFEHLRRAYD